MERACSLVEVDLDKDLGSSGAGSTHWSLHVCCADNCPAGGYHWWIEVTLSEASWVVKIKLPSTWLAGCRVSQQNNECYPHHQSPQVLTLDLIIHTKIHLTSHHCSFWVCILNLHEKQCMWTCRPEHKQGQTTADTFLTMTRCPPRCKAFNPHWGHILLDAAPGHPATQEHWLGEGASVTHHFPPHWGQTLLRISIVTTLQCVFTHQTRLKRGHSDCRRIWHRLLMLCHCTGKPFFCFVGIKVARMPGCNGFTEEQGMWHSSEKTHIYNKYLQHICPVYFI